MEKQELKKLEDQLNKMFEKPEFQALLPRSPNMRYWKAKKDHYACCWTTEPVKGKFYSCVYRILKNGSWTLKRKVAFGRRKIAKARARKWFEQRKEEIEK